MRVLYQAIATAAVLLSVTACAQQPRACTQIAARSGVGVTVSSDMAATVQSLRLKVCWSGDCAEGDVQLDPGIRSIDQGCSGVGGGGYSAVCSATMEPDGTLVGFLDVPRMPEGKITVTMTVIDRQGATLPPAGVTATAPLSFPNGRDCPGEAAQLNVSLDRTGLKAVPPPTGN